WLYVPEKTDVSALKISFKSGSSGWYSHGYNIASSTDINSGWNYLSFRTNEFEVSGSTQSWGNINGVRFTFAQSATVNDTTLIIDGLQAYKSATCSGSDGTKDKVYITATAVPFNQYSLTQNKIQFIVRNKKLQLGYSEICTAKTSDSSQLYGALKFVQSGPDPTFKLGEVYSFPNPAKYGKNPVLHIEVGIADKVDIGIYNIAGELIYTTNIDGNSASVVNNKYCYEQEWDSGGYASGVYIYLIKAHKSGYADIKAVKKLAVIR
ncbi:MAG: T9SS type A sorting domain-containing protein, partial [Elusimicrobiota bacterium]